jgi:hypothetical protein
LPLISTLLSLCRSPVAPLLFPLKLIGPPRANAANPNVILIVWGVEQEAR